MKRFWQEPASDLPSPNVLDGYCPSLKRVRLSKSPGELRLEGDLQNMTSNEGSWKHVDQRHWICKNTGALLEREFGNPMTFVLYISKEMQIWMEIGRSFPHEPPTITRVIHPCYRDGMVVVQPAMNTFSSAYESDTTIVYDQWSAVRRLEDLLGFLVDAMKQHQQPRNVITPTLAMEEDQDMSHLEHDRFDQDMDIRDDSHCIIDYAT